MTYYYIECIGLLAKKGAGISSPIAILDARRGWIDDEWSIVSDYLVGYDSSEDPGSPYRFGNGSVMSEIQEVDAKQAKLIMEDYHFVLGCRPEKWNP